MSNIFSVAIKNIEANPFRSLGEYPFVERKIETLKRSILDVGLWEGVIAREKGGKYQIAFGHHRVEAARRAELKEIPLIVRALSDKEMLEFMGRENMEDFNADFLCMLETWEAAVRFRSAIRNDSKPIDMAALLGWTYSDRGTNSMNATARERDSPVAHFAN